MYNPFHTPQEMQALSNLAHLIEGLILIIVAVIAGSQTSGYLNTGWLRYLWPGLIFIPGIFLLIFLLFHHGLDKIGISWTIMMSDPQQRQHLLMAILLLVAGLAEILYRVEVNPVELWRIIWPIVLVVIGVLFIVHTQHGTSEAVARAVIVHRFLGVSLALTGALKIADLLWTKQFPWLAYPWILFLFIVAVLLISYREPEGAYHGSNGNSEDQTRQSHTSGGH